MDCSAIQLYFASRTTKRALFGACVFGDVGLACCPRCFVVHHAYVMNIEERPGPAGYLGKRLPVDGNVVLRMTADRNIF